MHPKVIRFQGGRFLQVFGGLLDVVCADIVGPAGTKCYRQLRLQSQGPVVVRQFLFIVVCYFSPQGQSHRLNRWMIGGLFNGFTKLVPRLFEVAARKGLNSSDQQVCLGKVVLSLDRQFEVCERNTSQWQPIFAGRIAIKDLFAKSSCALDASRNNQLFGKK